MLIIKQKISYHCFIDYERQFNEFFAVTYITFAFSTIRYIGQQVIYIFPHSE